MAFADGLLSVRLACDDDDDDSTGELLRGGVRDTADPRSSIGRLGASLFTEQNIMTSNSACKRNKTKRSRLLHVLTYTST